MLGAMTSSVNVFMNFSLKVQQTKKKTKNKTTLQAIFKKTEIVRVEDLLNSLSRTHKNRHQN